MKLNNLLTLIVFLGLAAVQSCVNSSAEDPEPVGDLVVNDFLIFIDEGATGGSVIGTIDASTTSGTLTYSVLSQTPNGVFDVGPDGQITVVDASAFLFANNETIVGTVEVSNGASVAEVNVTININDPSLPSLTIWTGSRMTFMKANESDPGEEANQDRITDNVWITRGNDGGQIFNIKVESSSNKSTSPEDTEWALGTTAEIRDLTFNDFRNTISPQDVVGENLVLHLITDDIYIDVRFTSWSRGRQGGFSYERSTP